MADPRPKLAPAPPPDAKLAPPAPRAGLISRQALIAQLDAVWTRRLTLVSAPAGSGKSTTLAAWARAADEGPWRSVAWLNVDAGDADPWRFWSAAVFALRRARPSLGMAALSALVSSADPIEAALPGLIAELGAERAPIALVIDDLHLVGNPAVYRGISEFVARLPRAAHLVISTRVQPPVGVGRLRARGELLELGGDQLRFDRSEAGALLSEGLGLELTDDQVGRLNARIEGWAAGLYLACLSLRGRTDLEAFIEEFAGDDRHVVDYLGPEVVDSQDERTRDFLVRTSVLDRLCGELCDAVLDSSDSEATLAELERSNLFLIPLDTRRRWYRYHGLFRDLLLDRLDRERPGEARDLHARAASWYEHRGDRTSAVPHALAAEDTHLAARLVADVWLDVGNRGWMATVAGWLGRLPDELIEADPRLALARAWSALVVGTADDIEPWLVAAEARAHECPELPGATSVESSAAMARAMRGGHVGDVGRATAAARRAVSLETSPDSAGRARACVAYGLNLYWSGADEEAEHALLDAVSAAEASSQFIAAATAGAYLTLIELGRGDPDGAARHLQAAQTIAEERSLGELGQLSVLHLAAGGVLRATDRPVDALERLERAIALARTARAPVPLVAAQIELARARHELGERSAAEALLGSARAQLGRCADPGALVDRLASAESEVARPPRTIEPLREGLTERELEVLRLLPTLLSQREIAERLFVSRNTVKTHLRGIYRKLGAPTRTLAVARARELGLLE